MEQNSLSDRDLVRTLMFLNEWNQYDASEALGLSQPQISLIINQKQKLSKPARLLAKKLLEEAEAQKGEGQPNTNGE